MAVQEPLDIDDFDFDDEDEQIRCSASYFFICILLPSMSGLLNSFAWSGYTLHVRQNGWSLYLAGVAVSSGCLVRLVVQQVIFRLGIWTCVVFALLQVTIAIVALLHPNEAAAVFIQVGALPALDVTVAIEGLVFDIWSSTEVMVAQAQSSVLSIFTMAYALAATFGGVIYDLGGWPGVCIFHTACSSAQLLVLAVQPAMRKSFREFLHGEEEDNEAELENRATSIVPEPFQPDAVEEEAKEAKETKETKDCLRSSVEGLPGAVEEEPKALPPPAPKKSLHSMESEHSDATIPSRPGSRSRNRKPVKGGRASVASIRASKRSLLSNLQRNFRVTGRSTLSSGLSSIEGFRSPHRSEAGLRRKRSSAASGQTGQTNLTMKTFQSAFTALSTFSNLTKSGENFQYHYGIQNGLRPKIASRAVEMSIDSSLLETEEEEEEEEEKNGVQSQQGRGTVVRKTVREKKAKGITRDMYPVVFMIVLCAFNYNYSYGVEWQTFAIFFQEQHGWKNATWAGICQTSGDLIAGFVMALLKNGERPDLDELQGVRWLWHATVGHPYLSVLYAVGWAILMAALCVPVLPVAIASQVIMGTLFVFSVKAVTELNLFYSLGDSKLFLDLQVKVKNVEAVGSFLGTILAFPLYEYNPIAPYFVCSVLGLVTCVTLMIGFCARLGFGDEIEAAEARRARRLGLKRESTWKSQAKSVRQSTA